MMKIRTSLSFEIVQSYSHSTLHLFRITWLLLLDAGHKVSKNISIWHHNAIDKSKAIITSSLGLMDYYGNW